MTRRQGKGGPDTVTSVASLLRLQQPVSLTWDFSVNIISIIDHLGILIIIISQLIRVTLEEI